MAMAFATSSSACVATRGSRSSYALCAAPVRLHSSGKAVSRSSLIVRAESTASPVRQVLSQVAINVYKASALFSAPEAGLSPLWAALKKLDLGGVNAALRAGANPNERDAGGDTPLLLIARAGHYKYPPSEIPAALVKGGADMETTDKSGLTALQVSLLAGWQNIAELLIKSGASTAGVPAIKARLTCPDCKRLVAQYNL